MKHFTKDNLSVNILPNRAEMGRVAAEDIARAIRQMLQTKESINMIFAAAPSQDDMLACLIREPDIPWERINAFHMDEYIGLDAGAPQCFSNYLKERLFGKVPFRSVHLLDPAAADPEAECLRYAKLLAEHPVDIVCLGIGENGHIAFNDPHVALFDDPAAVKTVMLDEKCRNQQVNDGCFAALEQVPTHAITLTIPTLTSGKALFCVVPTDRKAEAVKNMVYGEVSERCPASILRKHPCAALYLDKESAGALE